MIAMPNSGHDCGGAQRPDIDGGGAGCAANRRDCHPQRHRKGGADARDQERAGDRGHGQHCQRQPDQEPDLGLRHVEFIMHLGNDRRHDQKRHAHGDASKPEETKQSSKTAGRATVAARRCWHENYPARAVTVPQRHPQSKQW
jgi:hypothetical protein